MLNFPKRYLLTACLVSAGALYAAPAQAREQIRIVGSSTVYPFTATAAEQFGLGGDFSTPLVESTGTGGGFKLFCAGVGEAHPDINDASRPITQSEKEACRQHGITHIVEIPIGYDGIVIANAAGAPPLDLTRKQLFLALARELPGKDGKLAANPYQKWSDIDPSLPAKAIEVYGPPPTSGTRDAFAELVMEQGCEEVPAFAAAIPDKKMRQKTCRLLREDGRYIEAGENDNLIVQKLTGNPDALGIFGYSFLDENRNTIQGSRIEGVAPTKENIENKSYKVSRSLYIYVKGEHLGAVPGLSEFVSEMVSNAAIGPYGYLTAKGLLPLHDKELAAAQAAASSLLKPAP